MPRGKDGGVKRGAVEMGEDAIDDATLPQKRRRKTCSVSGCTADAVARGVCRKHSSAKQPRQLCCMPGCKSQSVKDLLCQKHGAHGVCKAPTCLTMALNKSGLCRMHGANGFCSVDGCATPANSKGLCWTHGGGTRQPCCMPGCKTLSQKGLLCKKHGAYGVCKAPICLTMATNASGLCSKHGANGFCSVDGCATAAVSKGLCVQHGGGTNQLCCMPGCETPSVKDLLCKKHGAYGVCTAPTCLTMARNASGLCAKHGAHGFCSVEGCATAAQSSSKGLCAKHGGRIRLVCGWETGCTSFAKAQGRCMKHYACGMCAHEECPTYALKANGYCGKHGGRYKAKECSVPGCSSDARARGVCSKHRNL